MMTRMEPLAISIEISRDVPLPANSLGDLGLYVGRYAAQLGRNLGLSAEVSVTVTPADPAIHLPAQFRLRINNDVCRCRLWPYVPLDDLPLRELAAVLCEAIHHSRESLLTPAHSDFLARIWSVQREEEYPPGWTAAGFHCYLREFVRRNLSISRAKDSVETVMQKINSNRDIELVFEECLENSENLYVGIALRVGQAQLSAGSELADLTTRLSRAIALDPGVFLPSVVTTVDDDLDDNDFCIQINDVLLPPARGVPAHVERSITESLTRNAGSLLAAPIVQFLLDRVKGDYPDLVRQAQSQLNSLSKPSSNHPSRPPDRICTLRWTFTAILRHLLDEQVTIRDFHAVLESFLYLRVLQASDGTRRVVSFSTPVSYFHVADRSSLNELSIGELSQGARFCLRSLVLRYAKTMAQGTALSPLVFSQQIHQRLLEVAVRPLNPQEKLEIHQAVWDQVVRLGLENNTCIVVEQSLRRIVRELLSMEFPTIGIIGSGELARTRQEAAPTGVIDWPSVPAPLRVQASD